MTQGPNNTALTGLGQLPNNQPIDWISTQGILNGLFNQLGPWTLTVAQRLNILYQTGAITNGVLLIGDATKKAFDLASLTAGTNVIITPGAGAITIAVPGAIPPNPGTQGGILYYNTTTTLASSALLALNSLVVGGGSAAAPATRGNWTLALANPQTLVGSMNAAAAPAPNVTNTLIQLVGQDIAINAIELDAFASNNRLVAYRSEGTNASPAATAGGANALIIEMDGFDGTSRQNLAAQMLIGAVNTWSNTDRSTRFNFLTTPTGSTVAAQVAQLSNQGCSFTGTNTNDSATAGQIGEYASTITLIASEVSVNNVTANIATLSLTAGDWDVWGECWFDTLSGTATVSGAMVAAISTTSATLPTVPGDNTSRSAINATVLASSNKIPLPVAVCRISLAATTNVFLMGLVTTSAGTANAYGKIAARRVR